MTINEICEHITKLKCNTKMSGKSKIIMISEDLHRELGLKNRMPSVCRAMYRCMRENDKILNVTPTGFSSTIEIEYNL
jgi:nickel-dependent lactate racemase